EVLDYRQAIAFYAGAWQCVEGGGDHAFSGFDAQIPAILRFCALQGG
ncbi:MAG: YqiA/YcfP family alpha/beta fold hydrolase, partial [Casimicrobiaceae bacterium]